MTKITQEEVKNLLELSTMHLEDTEIEELRLDLEKIVSFVEELKEIDTTNVPPCTHICQELSNNFREDIEVPALFYPREAFLKNSPEHIAGQVRTPPIIKK
jgi:aspartyl-tRNA(Asn)/glutamyl-tRNA(Gln) amidotransferase subunit C